MNIVHSGAGPKLPREVDVKPENHVNLYRESPRVEMTIDDFEVYALKRLKVLRKIEQLKTMRVSAEQFNGKIAKMVKQELSDPSVDEASHFILRLSYCQTDDLRRWFLQQETTLFQHRLSHLSTEQLAKSVKEYAQIKPIPRAEKERLQSHLMQLMNPVEFAKSHFYAVPFQQALDLVAQRQCYLSQGNAYIPQAKVLSILVAKFRSELSRCLVLMANTNTFRNVEDPEAVRIYPLLQNLNSCLVNEEPSGEQGLTGSTGLTAANVDRMAPHMPLCMRQLQAGLQQDKKLRHWGRLQYGLFLKFAGLSMEDALAFFQRHFTSVTGEQFQKQYAYNIRHMYGKEGKRATYTAYNCSKIIMGNAPSTGDHHGCPYKHFDNQHLEQTLQRLKIGTDGDRRAIMALKKSHQYQLACQKHFEVSHEKANSMEVSVDNVGNHPNAWFRASVNYAERLAERDGTTSMQVSP
jgi:DNA primase large subunit